MSLTTLYPPIAAATFVWAFIGLFVWREHKKEMVTGEPTLAMALGGLAYIGGLFAYFYFHGEAKLTTQLDIFMAAMVGLTGGVVLVFGVMNALYYSRGWKPIERALSAAGAIFLLWLCFHGLFTGE